MKKNKSKYVVDLTEIWDKDASTDDVKVAYIRAKATSGIPVSNDDVDFLIVAGIKVTLNAYKEFVEDQEKNVIRIKDNKLYNQLEKAFNNAMNPKKPWYKRFWGWITKPFNKK